MNQKKPRLTSQHTQRLRMPRRKQNAFQRFNSNVVDFFSGSRRRRSPNVIEFKRRRRSALSGILIGLSLFLVVGLVSFLFWFFTHENAYAVYLNDNLMGNIVKNEKISDDEILKTVNQKLVAQLGTNVQINEAVNLKSVRADGKEIVSEDHVIGKIASSVTYKIEAAVITVDGAEMVTVSSPAVADEIFRELKARFIPPDSNMIEAETKFLQEVVYKLKYVNTDEVIKQDLALTKLSTEKETPQKYTVKEGDTLNKIAINHNLTLEQVLAANEGMTPNTKIKINQEIDLLLPEPLISVRTVEETVLPDVAPKPITRRNIPNKPSTYKKVIQYGKDGQRNVTVQIERINGVETGNRKEISEEIIVPPVEEIIEVGQA